MASPNTVIEASGINPFDRSYGPLQRTLDTRLMSLLSEMLNWTVRVVITPRVTDLPGYEESPNTWVVEQVAQGRCHVSSTTVVLSPESPGTVHYSLGISSFRPLAYLKAQSTREANNMYLIPFSPDVWLCLGALLLTITVTLTFILSRETRLPHNTPYDIIARMADDGPGEGDPCLEQREHWEMSEILLVALGAICQQGSARDPSTSAARTLLLVLFLLAVLVFTAYSASVISLISLLPATQRELHGVVPYAVPSATLVQDANFFEHQFDTELSRPFQLVSVEGGLRAAMDGRAVFVAERDVALTTLHRLGVTADRRCSLARVYLGLEYQRVFVLRNGSRFRDPFNHSIIRLRQHGLLARERRAAFDTRYPCSPKERASLSGFVSVALSDTGPALFLLGWGLLLAVLVLLLEYIVYYSVLGVQKVFRQPWKAVDTRVEKILHTFQQRRQREINTMAQTWKLTNATHRTPWWQKIKWLFARGTTQPPYIN